MHQEKVHHAERHSAHLSILHTEQAEASSAHNTESASAHHSMLSEVHRSAANLGSDNSLFAKPPGQKSPEQNKAETDSSAAGRNLEQEKNASIADLQLTNDATNLSTLLDKNIPEQERLSTAMGLLAGDSSGVFSMTDSSGSMHELHIEKLEVDGKTVIRVSESGQTLAEGVVEKGSPAKAETARADGLPKIPTEQPQKMQSAGPQTKGDAGGHYVRVPKQRPAGMSYGGGGGGGGRGHYSPPDRGSDYNPEGVDHSKWQGVRHSDGSVAISFRGCQVDTDGSGAYRHREDATRQGQTSLRLSDGTSLDTDKHNFFVLPPSVAHAYGIKLGDLGWLVQKQSGNAVPVVFGDSGPEGKLGEASVAALKSLGYDNVSGANGVEKSEEFEIVFVPGSGNGTGDIANSPQAMADKLSSLGSVPDSKSADSGTLPS